MSKEPNRVARVVLALTALLTVQLAGAAVPESISYQGYLTDRFGQPNSETLDITFSVYTAPVGGAALWTDVQSVSMFQGLFTVALGSDANPFPAGLFDTPLWLGITVADDNEMEPRRALTSVGFAFKADDAISLQGLTPAELDQSQHVDDAGNPHGVSAGQIGAASNVALGVHVGDTGNPHSTTAVAVGAAGAAEFASHTVGAEAHHGRYSDAEAVAAMGGPADGNSLNHVRYDDGDAVGAILAADGEGSGLDADLVDGLQAEELISAIATASQTGYVFAGFTTSMLEPRVGPLGMNAECKTDFGPLARISLTREIIETAPTTPLSGSGWVRPSEVQSSCAGTGSSSDCTWTDASGEIAGNSPEQFDCNEWTAGSGSALVVEGSTMAIQLVTCELGTMNHVACSVPVTP